MVSAKLMAGLGRGMNRNFISWEETVFQKIIVPTVLSSSKKQILDGKDDVDGEI